MVGLIVGVGVKLVMDFGFIGTGEADVRLNLIGFVGVVFVLDPGNLKTITGLLLLLVVVVVVVVTPEDRPNTEHLVGLVDVVVPSNDNFFTSTILGAVLALGEDCTSGGGPV